MKEKAKSILTDVGSGALIGVASAIPGVSGGTIATQLHVYDKHLDHMNDLRHQFFKNLLILLPLILGILIGVIPAIILFKKAFEGFVFGMVTLFAGFIIGGLPSVFDEVKGKKSTKKCWIILGVALLIAVGLGLVSGLLTLNGIDVSLFKAFNMNGSEGYWIEGGHVEWWVYLTLIPIGMIAAAALIVPGISGSMILLITGYYNPLLSTTHWIKDLFQGKINGEQLGSLIGIYGCFLIGILIGFFTLVKLMTFLFKKYRLITFYAIIGFIFGSLFSLYFNNQIIQYYQHWTDETVKHWFSMPVEIIISVALLIIGITLSYLIVRAGRKNQKNQVKE